MASVEFNSRGASAAAGASAARNVAGACVAGLLIAAIEFAVTRGSVQYSVLEQIEWMARLSVHWILAALPVGVAFWAVERRATGGSPSGIAYTTAVAAGAIVGACVMALHGKFVDPVISRTAVGFDMELSDRFLYGLWQLAFWGSAGAALHASDLRHKRSAAALRQGELARLKSERRLAEVRLAALHAQVEPEFVLTTLDTVERLYIRDTAAADRLLDALIEFLREATPLLRRQRSTIDQECRLLHLYLRVLGAASGLADDVRVAVDPSIRHMPLPPGILVSLAQQVLGSLAAGPARFDVRSRRRDDGHDLDLSATAVDIEYGAALQDFVGRARERLRLAQGPQGDITLLHDTPGRLTLRIALVNRQGADHDDSAEH
jgi:hypothetical protein